jgi:putative ubiquitin-RnfH superfamily antitoxin RatB of RatAB toxin-antitoxin module
MTPIRVEVVYAEAEAQAAVTLALAPGSTVGEAITASGLLLRYPGIDLQRDGFGIYGRRCSAEEGLSDGDRVEIYRPLAADAKDNRRRRVAASRKRR